MPNEPCHCGALDCRSCFPSTRSRKLAQAISPEEYAEKSYAQCPVCTSTALGCDPIDIDGPLATQGISCADCEATWTDVYRLEGYIDLDISH